MKQIKKLIFGFLFIVPLFLTGCLISEVQQSTQVNAGEEFTATLTIGEMTAESGTEHKGALMVLVPEDWTFVSGTYNATTTNGLQSGNMVLNTDENPVYGDIDTIIAPPTGMKWVDLLSDAGYFHPENVTHEVTVNFQVGTTTGDFNIGYAATKNTVDMLGSINPEDTDNASAWTDTSMNHLVTVVPSTSVKEDKLNGMPKAFALQQNYPNPFNPSTIIKYSIAEGSNVKLAIYDVSGKEIYTLAEGFRAAGNYSIDFSAAGLASGIYYYRLEAGSFTQTNKMIFMK